MSFNDAPSMGFWTKRLFDILRAGEIPKHIAIIMDGNRRYARNQHLPTVYEGHKQGAAKLKEVIEWLHELKSVHELTVYAFSLLNFNRNQQEVEWLMDLAEETFGQISEKQDLFTKYKCKVRFIGHPELLEERVQSKIKAVEKVNVEKPELILNICVAYTSQDEIELARDQCAAQNVEPNYDEIFSRLQLPSKPDLLIRTSGVLRMSNFLLMQCSTCPIIVTDVMWPALSPFTMFKILLQYQLRRWIPYA